MLSSSGSWRQSALPPGWLSEPSVELRVSVVIVSSSSEPTYTLSPSGLTARASGKSKPTAFLTGHTSSPVSAMQALSEIGVSEPFALRVNSETSPDSSEVSAAT